MDDRNDKTGNLLSGDLENRSGQYKSIMKLVYHVFLYSGIFFQSITHN